MWCSVRPSPENVIGVGILPRWNGKLLLEVRQSDKWEKTVEGLRIGCGSIGGTLEPGETLKETLQREAMEEIGCPVRIDEIDSSIRIIDDRSVVEANTPVNAVFEFTSRSAG